MARRTKPLRLLVTALAVVFACDSSYSWEIEVDIPDEVLARYSEEAPGVLLARVRRTDSEYDPIVQSYGIVCGRPEDGEFTVREGGEGGIQPSDVVVWIAPYTDDDPEPCGQFTFPGGSGIKEPTAADPQATTTLGDPGCGAEYEESKKVVLALP